MVNVSVEKNTIAVGATATNAQTLVRAKITVGVEVGEQNAVNVAKKREVAGVVIGTPVVVSSDAPIYNGDYEVIPKTSATTLSTTNKLLTDDVRVHPVPYQETPLQGGGIEVNIGG